MDSSIPEEIFRLPKLKLAVIGHVEWVTFLKVDHLPIAGHISHAKDSFEEPAGGGAVVAIQLAKLLGSPVQLITALGNDSIGEKSFKRLEELGLKLSVAWREKPTRKGISFTENDNNWHHAVLTKKM